MNILCVVFVNEKPVWKKIQENPSKNMSVEKKLIIWRYFAPFKSSHRRCTIKKDVKNFASFTGKHLCWSLFLTKLLVSRPTTLLKRDSNTGAFLQKFRHFSERLFKEHLKKWASSNRCFLPFKGKMSICNKFLYALESALYFNHGYNKLSCIVLCMKFLCLFFKTFV